MPRSLAPTSIVLLVTVFTLMHTASAATLPAPSLSYNPNNDGPAGAATTVAPEEQASLEGDYSYTLGGGAQLVDVNDPTTPGITKAYSNPQGMARPINEARELRPDNVNPTTADFTGELWVNLGAWDAENDHLANSGMLWETGGTLAGASLAVDSVTHNIVLSVASLDQSDGQNIERSFELSYTPSQSDADRFAQLVFVIDVGGAIGEDSTLSLYVDGELADSTDANLTRSDTNAKWAANNGTGWGAANDVYPGPTDGTPFDGLFGLQRFYTQALDDEQVQLSYGSVIPEPSSVMLLVVGSLCVTGRWRRRQR